MLTPDHLLMVVVGIPLFAGILMLLAATDLSERHHLHHDTYSISQAMPNTLVLVMVFMGVLGALTGWLCHLGVFGSDPIVPLGFFASFQMALLFAFFGVIRCRVMAYDDRMVVRPWIGRSKQVAYKDIVRMVRSLSLLSPHFHDLRVYTASGDRVRVSGLLDVEQMLVRIDRFDVLEG